MEPRLRLGTTWLYRGIRVLRV